MSKPKIKQTECDTVLFCAVALLILTGLVMVFSASGVYALEVHQDSYYFLKRQIVWVTLGSIVLWIAWKLDYRYWDRLTYPGLIVTFILLVALLFPMLGVQVHGARRWISVLGIRFQPSELAKFTLILFLAKSLVKREDKFQDFMYGYLPNLIVLGVFFFMILIQPDFGTAVLISLVAFSMFFIAGIRFKFLVYSVLAILPFLVSAVMSADYRARRILAFIDPYKNADDSGFQAVQSFIAFGRGGLWGSGPGDGKQKLFYLPEAHTDFIFSVIGEELGFIGAIALIALFGILVWRGFLVALHAKDSFGTYLALGLTLLIGVQALTNMGVAVGMLPTKGLPLPFISLGGSSLIVCMLGMGVLLNISEHSAH